MGRQLHVGFYGFWVHCLIQGHFRVWLGGTASRPTDPQLTNDCLTNWCTVAPKILSSSLLVFLLVFYHLFDSYQRWQTGNMKRKWNRGPWGAADEDMQLCGMHSKHSATRALSNMSRNHSTPLCPIFPVSTPLHSTTICHALQHSAQHFRKQKVRRAEVKFSDLLEWASQANISIFMSHCSGVWLHQQHLSPLRFWSTFLLKYFWEVTYCSFNWLPDKMPGRNSRKWIRK